MILWFALFIPILACLFYLIYLNNDELKYHVCACLIAISIGVVLVGSKGCEAVLTTDTEYWGGWVQSTEYYEAWDEEVPCRHPIPCTHPRYCTETDSKGNTRTYQCGTEHIDDGHYHAYDVDNHPPYWTANGSNGENFPLSSDKFEELAKQFGNRNFVELNRKFHSKDGDKYISYWKGEDKTLEPVTTIHKYKNRVQASKSIFTFPKTDPKQYMLFEYPRLDGYSCQMILGNAPKKVIAEQKLALLNSKLGSKKQVRVWILLFKGKPYQTGVEQQNYWQGGNKNEFVVTIGTDNQYNVTWCYVFSWSEVEKLKVETRQFVLERQGKQVDLASLIDWLYPNIQQQFKRKQFADFEYLTVETPLSAVLWCYGLIILINIGAVIWRVKVNL